MVKADEFTVQLVIVLVNCHIERPLEPIGTHIALHLNNVFRFRFGDTVLLQLLKRLVTVGLVLAKNPFVG